MEIFIAVIAVLCGYPETQDEPKYEQCVIEYINCAVGKAGETDMVKLNVCADQRGADFESAKTKASSLN